MIVNEMYQGQGLGNQIWNLLATRIIAEKMNYEWGINVKKPFKASHFLPNMSYGINVTTGDSPEGGPPTVLPDDITNYYKEPMLHYPPDMGGEDASFFDSYFWESLPDNTKIDGIFQKIGYIKDRRKEISYWLEPSVKNYDYFNDDICVIHFRGNDYLGTTAWTPSEYYKNASEEMLKINSNMKFFVVTDDEENAKNFIPFAEIIGANKSNWVFDERLQESRPDHAIDYSIIYYSKYLIISSSTFSFWPAWASPNVKKVIAPKYWFDHKISNGWWRPDDSIVDDWFYLDREGNLTNGVECKEQYERYKLTNNFYHG